MSKANKLGHSSSRHSQVISATRRQYIKYTFLGLISILSFVAVLNFHWAGSLLSGLRWKSSKVTLSLVENILLNTPDGRKIREYTEYYTSESHLPGQGRQQAEWTQTKWKEFGITDTEISTHPMVMAFPGTHRLALIDLDKKGDDRLLHEAALTEDPALASHAKNSSQPFVPAMHAWSGTGNVTAPFVFANFGDKQDFDDLRAANVTLEGKIAIVKVAQVSPYYHEHQLEVFRGFPIDAAQKAGMVGVIMYGDPEKDAEMVESNGYQPFPYGPARPATTIERGTVGRPEIPQDDLDSLAEEIPSIPISYTDAIPLLKALNGHGPAASQLPQRWRGGALGYKGVSYNTGPTPDNVVINLENRLQREKTHINNVVGRIEGSDFPDEVIILGNHRDAWGPGAGDPGSGSSTLNEVVRSFGVALKTGWQPRRTILFVSFEGEEISQFGSRLWIPPNFEWLNKTLIAYINVVVAASGSHFHLKASPLLHRAAIRALEKVPSPNQTVAGQSVADIWDGVIGRPGGGDAIAFASTYCFTTLDFGFSPALNEPVFPYHSQFDNVAWMDAYGDPEWKYHMTSAKIWSMITIDLLESLVLPLGVKDYAIAARMYLDILQRAFPAGLSGWNSTMLDIAIQQFQEVGTKVDRRASELNLARGRSPAWWNFWSQKKLMRQIRDLNQLYIALERNFYYHDAKGPDTGENHVLFIQSAWHNDGQPLPGLWEAFSSRNLTEAYRWERIIADRINAATGFLSLYLDT